MEDCRTRMTRLRLDDWKKLSAIAIQNHDLLKYSPSEIHTKTKLKKYIRVAVGEFLKDTWYPYLIFDKETKKYAGCTSFGNYVVQHKRVEIGWTWLGREFQGTGLNKHVKYLMLGYAFEKLNMNRVEFKID